jgi:ribosome recycling factor
MATLDGLLQDAGRRMDKSVESTRHELNSIRTGRASPAILDRIQIDYYGQPTPLNQMAQIGAPESRLLTIQPYDPTQIKAIEKAIAESDLGLTPSNDGKVIRLPIPQLTEERRKEFVKIARNVAEEGRVAVRNVRRDLMKHLEELVRNGEVGDDEERRAEGSGQKLTDDHTKSIDELLKHKEAEIMEV